MMQSTMFQQRLRQIQQMPPGQEKEAAMAALTRDYPGEMDKMNQQYGLAQALALKNAPRGAVAGNNKYSVYVGRGGEALLNGVQQGLAHKRMRDIDKERDVMSGQKQGATRALMEAGMQGAQASALRGGGNPPHGQPGHQCPPGLTPEECAQREMMMQRSGYGPGASQA